MRVPRVLLPKHTRVSCVYYWGLPIKPRGWRWCWVPSDEVRLISKGSWPMQAHQISEECVGGCVMVISHRPTTHETSPQPSWEIGLMQEVLLCGGWDVMRMSSSNLSNEVDCDPLISKATTRDTVGIGYSPVAPVRSRNNMAIFNIRVSVTAPLLGKVHCYRVHQFQCRDA